MSDDEKQHFGDSSDCDMRWKATDVVSTGIATFFNRCSLHHGGVLNNKIMG
jgi:hypothetical protein